LGDKKKEAFTERMIEWFALIAEARLQRHWEQIATPFVQSWRNVRLRK